MAMSKQEFQAFKDVLDTAQFLVEHFGKPALNIDEIHQLCDYRNRLQKWRDLVKPETGG